MKSPDSRKIRNGFTVAEMLIVLFIMGMLMAALAVAFQASVTNFTENEEIYKAMNTSRQSLLRITNDLRSANVTNDGLNDQCNMVTADGRNITYRFNSDDNTLYLIVNAGPTAGTFKMCENVTVMTFDKATRIDDDGNTLVRNVQVSITVTINDNSRTLVAAAVVRRNI